MSKDTDAQGAILAKAFGENYRLLTSMLESTDDNVKKLATVFWPCLICLE